MVVVVFLLAVDVDSLAVDSDVDVVDDPPMELCVVLPTTKVDLLLSAFDPTDMDKVVVDMLPLPMEVDMVADVLDMDTVTITTMGVDMDMALEDTLEMASPVDVVALDVVTDRDPHVAAAKKLVL